MPVEIKYCGMTRREDVAVAEALGASYVGAIFAGGQRNLAPEAAAMLFSGLRPSVRRVGVFGHQPVGEIERTVAAASLDVVQLHGDWSAPRIAELRASFGGEIWPVVRIGSRVDPTELAAAFDTGDAVLVDALVPGSLGGTGTQLAWESLAETIRIVRAGRRLVLAGGLRPENVAAGIEILSPDVVDVSSGVESAPGLKDRDKMKAFRDAVAGAPTAK